MLNSEALEVGIGMAFLFLLMSLVCTGVKEWLEGIFKWRAMDLERAVRALLDDTDGTVTSFIYNHPLVYSLFQGRYEPTKLTSSWLTPGANASHVRLHARRNLPSYIPAGNFAKALMDLVLRGSSAGGQTADALTVENLRRSALEVASPHLRSALLVAIDHAAGDLERVRSNLQDWFDSAMDRASGWYKRRTQTVLFAIGLAAAVLLNVDALHVMQALTTDKAFREVVVQAAARAQAPDVAASAASLAVARAARNEMEAVGMPIGWRTTLEGSEIPAVPRQLCSKTAENNSADLCSADHTLPGWAAAVTGWFITALAIMLGAPFWFDVLNKFMVIRATVKPKEKSPEEGSEDRQPKTKVPGQSGDGAPLHPPPAPAAAPLMPNATEGQEAAAPAAVVPREADAEDRADEPFERHEWTDDPSYRKYVATKPIEPGEEHRPNGQAKEQKT